MRLLIILSRPHPARIGLCLYSPAGQLKGCSRGRIKNTKHKECDLGLKFAVHMNQNRAKRKFGKPFLCIDKQSLAQLGFLYVRHFKNIIGPSNISGQHACFIQSNLSYRLLTGRAKPIPLLAMMTSMLKGTEQRQKSKHIFKATCL